jgi:hypothetical protein
MKKIIIALLVCGSIFSATAQTDSTRITTTTTTTTTHKYFYYPSTNIYFDEASGNYWYLDNDTEAWNMVRTLPSTITVTETTERYPVTYMGDDPWKENAEHIKKYKVKDGKEKIKTTSAHKYFYYPSSNLYYDEVSGNYWYWDKGTSAWSMTENLPSTINFNKSAIRYPLTYTGDDPWKYNADDIKKYKSKDGKEKIKTGDSKIKTKDDK